MVDSFDEVCPAFFKFLVTQIIVLQNLFQNAFHVNVLEVLDIHLETIHPFDELPGLEIDVEDAVNHGLFILDTVFEQGFIVFEVLIVNWYN